MIPLLWVDLETTGLDPKYDLVLEVAARLTDEDLVETSRFSTVINYPPDAYNLTHLPPDVLRIHSENGLLEESAVSKVSLEDTRSLFANWLFSNFSLGERRPLAGSNPGFDRSFLEFHFPDCTAWLHYHNFDMNTLYYFFDLKKDRKKKNTHRANDDLDWDVAHLQQLHARALLR